MKKLALLLAAGVMALTLSACGGEEKPKEPVVNENQAMQPKASEEAKPGEEAKPAAEQEETKPATE